jgi:Tol biopolymer transport system component
VPAQGPIIAFTSGRDGNDEIYKMNEDGSNQTNLTKNAASDTQAAVSPDGTKIAFVRRDYDGEDPKGEIFVMNADGSNQMNRTKNAGDDFSPAWSPDGAHIAFTSTRDGNPEVYIMDATDGANQENITNNPARDSGPEFQPDGSTIAFTTDRDGNDEIYITTTHGDGMVFNYTRNPAESDFGVNWSTNGQDEFLAYTRNVYNQETGSFNYEVYEMGLAGHYQTNLTKSAATHELHPSYSGDGTKIAFTTNRNLNLDIYKMNRDGSSPVQLTTSTASDSDPDWAKKAPSQLK